MFNRSQILTAAWKSYRLARPCFNAAGDVGGKFVFLPSLFAKMLRNAWAEARKVAATAKAFVDAEARAVTAKAAAMAPGERSARISQLRDELALLDYAPLGVRTGNRRRDLAAQLNAFAAV